ncbi:hypothetical protein ACLOJK_008987 [Asimina triloba]
MGRHSKILRHSRVYPEEKQRETSSENLSCLADVASRKLVGKAFEKQPLVFACKLVGFVDFDVAVGAERGFVRAANHCCRSFLAYIALDFHLSWLQSDIFSASIILPSPSRMPHETCGQGLFFFILDLESYRQSFNFKRRMHTHPTSPRRNPRTSS